MSQIKVDTITDEAGTGAPSFPNGLSGDGSSLTDLNAAELTGTLPALDGSALTGVGGGGWELLQNTEITSDLAYIDYTFPDGYSEFMFLFQEFRSSLTGDYDNPVLRMRLKDSGGSLITSADYSTKSSSSTTSGNSSTAISIMKMAITATSNPATQSGFVRIIAPKGSNIQTRFESGGSGRQQLAQVSGGLTYNTHQEIGHANTVQVNPGVRFLSFNSGTAVYTGDLDSTSGRYVVYGAPDA